MTHLNSASLASARMGLNEPKLPCPTSKRRDDGATPGFDASPVSKDPKDGGPTPRKPRPTRAPAPSKAVRGERGLEGVFLITLNALPLAPAVRATHVESSTG